MSRVEGSLYAFRCRTIAFGLIVTLGTATLTASCKHSGAGPDQSTVKDDDRTVMKFVSGVAFTSIGSAGVVESIRNRQFFGLLIAAVSFGIAANSFRESGATDYVIKLLDRNNIQLTEMRRSELRVEVARLRADYSNANAGTLVSADGNRIDDPFIQFYLMGLDVPANQRQATAAQLITVLQAAPGMTSQDLATQGVTSPRLIDLYQTIQVM